MDRRLSWLELGARPALFPALFLVGGALFGVEQERYGAAFLLASATLGAGAFLFAHRTGAHLLLLAACATAGTGLSTLASDVRVPASLQPREKVLIEGEVEGVLPLQDATRLDLAVSRADGQPARFRARLYLRGPDAEALFPGQRILVPTRLKPIDPPLNPGQPDFASAQRRRGVRFTGSADPARVVALSPPAAWQRWLRRTHAALAARVRALAPGEAAAALYLTLAAGQRAELGDELEARFSASGLAHVLSVSGLHVAVLALALLRGLRFLVVRLWPLARRVDARRIAAPLAVPLVWAYVVFTGNQMPAVRSAVMATAVLLGLSLWRRSDALNALALAALALVAFDPACIGELSTQLSLLAVTSLVLVAPALRDQVPIPAPDPQPGERWRYHMERVREAVLGTFCASVAVTFVSAPLVANMFQRLSLAGLVSNIVCLPLCGLLALLAAFGAAAFVVSPTLADPLLWLGTRGSQLLLWAVDVFAALPGASVAVATFGLAGTACWLLGAFGWAVGRGRWRWVGLVAPVALVWAWVVPRLLPGPGLTVTFLSVGHGDAIVLSSGGQHAIVDGGGSTGGGDTGRRYVLPFLREAGIDRFELAVLSHPHPDHALGLVSTLQEVPTRRLWVPPDEGPGELQIQVIAAAGSAEVELVDASRPPLVLGEAELRVLGPPRDRVLLEGVNDRSVVLQVRHGEVTFLLTGDIEEAAEEAITFGPATVVKVPHHGSRTSSTPGFVARTRPKVAVFCVGRYNRFRFPHDEVEARYRDAGAACYRTDRDGAIRIESDGRDVRVETFLPRQPRPAAPPVARAVAAPQPSGDDP